MEEARVLTFAAGMGCGLLVGAGRALMIVAEERIATAIDESFMLTVFGYVKRGLGRMKREIG